MKSKSASVFRKHWRALSQTSMWLIGVVSTFVFSPPTEVGTDSQQTFKVFAAFVLAVLGGVLALPFSKYKQRQAAAYWAIGAGAVLVLGSSLFFVYQNLRSEFSVNYMNSHVVIGSQFTHDGQIYAHKEQGFTREQAVFDTAGKPAIVWTAESIHANAAKLYVAYFFVIITLSLSAMMAIQARYCALQNRSHASMHSSTRNSGPRQRKTSAVH